MKPRASRFEVLEAFALACERADGILSVGSRAEVVDAVLAVLGLDIDHEALVPLLKRKVFASALDMAQEQPANHLAYTGAVYGSGIVEGIVLGLLFAAEIDRIGTTAS